MHLITAIKIDLVNHKIEQVKIEPTDKGISTALEAEQFEIHPHGMRLDLIVATDAEPIKPGACFVINGERRRYSSNALIVAATKNEHTDTTQCEFDAACNLILFFGQQ